MTVPRLFFLRYACRFRSRRAAARPAGREWLARRCRGKSWNKGTRLVMMNIGILYSGVFVNVTLVGEGNCRCDP